MRRCPDCPFVAATFEEVADHMMDAHEYLGVWESEVPDSD